MPLFFYRPVLERFMTKSQLDNLEQEYQDNKRSRQGNRRATDVDLMILRDYKKGMLIGEICKKYNKGRGYINTSLRVAAISKIS